MVNLVNSFTLEASFCGIDSSQAFQFNSTHLKKIGASFAQTVFQYISQGIDPCKIRIPRNGNEAMLLEHLKSQESGNIPMLASKTGGQIMRLFEELKTKLDSGELQPDDR